MIRLTRQGATRHGTRSTAIVRLVLVQSRRDFAMFCRIATLIVPTSCLLLLCCLSIHTFTIHNQVSLSHLINKSLPIHNLYTSQCLDVSLTTTPHCPSYRHTNNSSQAAKVAKASARAAPSVTARSYATTSRASPSPPSAVSPAVAV